MIVFFYAMMVYATTNLQQQDAAFSGDVFAILLTILLAGVFVVAVWLVVVSRFSQDNIFFCCASARRRVRELPRRLSSFYVSGSPSAIDAAPGQAPGDSDGGGAPVCVEVGDLTPRDLPQDAARAPPK